MAQVAIRFSEPEGAALGLDGDRRPGDPPRVSRRWATASNAADRARRRTRNTGGQ